MALPAANHFMLANQWEFRRSMIKVSGLYIIPFLCCVTIAAFQLEIFAMRGLHGIYAKSQKQCGH